MSALLVEPSGQAGTCLMAVSIPPVGGDTLFADQHAALAVEGVDDDEGRRLLIELLAWQTSAPLVVDTSPEAGLPGDGHVHTEFSRHADNGSMLASCTRAAELGLPSIAFGVSNRWR